MLIHIVICILLIWYWIYIYIGFIEGHKWDHNAVKIILFILISNPRMLTNKNNRKDNRGSITHKLITVMWPNCYNPEEN